MRKTTKVLIGILIVVVGLALLGNFIKNEVNTYRYAFTVHVEEYGTFFTDTEPTITDTGVAFIARDGKLKVFNGYRYHVDAWIPTQSPIPDHN